MNKIYLIYKKLLKEYSYQGWWPVLDFKGKSSMNEKYTRGYHPKDYSFPRNEKERFEIIIGAVLTQNTAWLNVQKALLNLEKLNAINPEKLLSLGKNVIREAIKPAGYFNQKSEYLVNITKFFQSLKGKCPKREELMQVKGVGNETADSILLYAYSQPHFVVDAYTKRIFRHLGILKGNETYSEIKALFEERLPKNMEIYQEYHALIVEHTKNYYKKRPYKDELLNAFRGK